jgi:hypothetical protein
VKALPANAELERQRREVELAKLKAEMEDMPEDRALAREYKRTQIDKMKRPVVDKQQAAQINKVENDLATLEREARSAWAKWGQFKPGVDMETDSSDNEQAKTEKERLRATAAAAQEAYINAALQAAQRFPDQYQVQMDTKGWPVIKRGGQGGGMSRPGAQQSATPSKYQGATIGMDAVRQYAAEQGIDEAEALRRFQAKGLNVRQ